MKNEYIHARTCVYNLNYHIVWCVKYRRKALTPEIEERLYEILRETAAEKGFEMVECRAGLMDHVHCLVSAPPSLSVTQIVKYLKGISGRLLLKEFPDLRAVLFRGQLWSGSYFCEALGSPSEEHVKAYIERQSRCQI